jgi:cysteine synthase
MSSDGKTAAENGGLGEVEQSGNQVVGSTPLVSLTSPSSGSPTLYVKLENQNPSGSVRDRYMEQILLQLSGSGQMLRGDSVSIAGATDATLSACCLAVRFGVDVEVFVPEGASMRLIPLIELYGGTVTWTEEKFGVPGAIERAAKWARHSSNRHYIDGFRREAVRGSYAKIVDEILEQLGPNRLLGLVTSMTSGATYRRLAEVLSTRCPGVQLCGTILKENRHRTVKADDFNESVRQFPLSEAWPVRDEFARTTGLLLGPKGALCVLVARQIREKMSEDGALVIINPDAGQRYLGWEERILGEGLSETSTNFPNEPRKENDK